MAGPVEYAVDMSGFTIVEMVTEAELLCQQQSFHEALGLATQCVNRIEEELGKESLRLIDPYIVIGLANAGLGMLTRSEKILAVANFVLVKHPDAPAETKSKLYRALGAMYTAREKYPEALRILADDVYHSSIAYGPESSRTAGGYYLMADVFDKYGDTDTSTALRNKVAQIWRKSLSVVVEASRAGEEDAPTLQPLEIAAAQNQLIGLIGNYADLELTENEGQASVLLSILYYAIGEIDLMREYVTRASEKLPAGGKLLQDANYLLDIVQ
eukprot:m.452496 g.452496  ORF g.452496 m.452496 type:complete len:271 (+) comp20340_c0_seq1:24-836(+)